MERLDRLRGLLAREKFPLEFTFKFVGKNSTAFESGVKDLAALKPGLKRKSRRESAHGKHVAYTFVFKASSPEAIIEIFKMISTIADVLIVL